MNAIKLPGRITRLAVLICLCVFAASTTIQAATFQLPEGTEIKVKFNSATKINSGTNKVGDELMITLADPITIGDRILIAEGAAGKAIVKEVEKASAPGKPGKIVIEFSELGTRGGFKTADGKAIKLGGTVEMEGKGKKILAYVTIVGIFLIKGGQGEIDLNETYTGKIGETVVLTSE